MPSPIKDKFLEPNFLFGLEFAEGFIFGRVVRTRQMRFKPYSVIDSNGNTTDISSNTHQSELRLRDPRNTENDILYLDTARDDGMPWFLHGSIGIRPSQVRMYPRFPEGQTIPGKFPNIDPVSPSTADDVGYISRERSPYEEPTDWVEWTIPPRTHFGVEYYNEDDDRSHNPVLNLLFSLYHFQPLSPEQEVDRRLISSIAARQVPATLLPAGAPANLTRIQNTQDEWGVKPLELDEAAELTGGR